MNRRKFLRTLAGGTAAAVAVRSWPFRTFFIPPASRIPLALELENVREEIPELTYSLWNNGWYQPGQTVAVYGSIGGQARGVFRVVSVDGKSIDVQYIPHHVDRAMAKFKRDIDALTGAFEPETLAWTPNESQWAAWRRKLKRA